MHGAQRRRRGNGDVQLLKKQRLFASLALPKRSLHETVTGDGGHAQAIAGAELTNFRLACGRTKGVILQPVVVQGPFHQPYVELLGYWKFVSPLGLWERLDLSVDWINQTALHISEAVFHRPLAVQPPSTIRSIPVT